MFVYYLCVQKTQYQSTNNPKDGEDFERVREPSTKGHEGIWK
jgi:hypothetical protein